MSPRVSFLSFFLLPALNDSPSTPTTMSETSSLPLRLLRILSLELRLNSLLPLLRKLGSTVPFLNVVVSRLEEPGVVPVHRHLVSSLPRPTPESRKEKEGNAETHLIPLTFLSSASSLCFCSNAIFSLLAVP